MSDPNDPHPLDNPGWHALTTVHAEFAEGAGRARRYLTDVSVFAAVDDGSDESWAALAGVVGPGGIAILYRTTMVAAPSSWTTHDAGPAHQMLLTGPPAGVPEPPGDATIRALTTADVPEMLALVKLTKPGPFRPRTIELGGYHGVFVDGRLVAMAGQRTRLPGFTEVSAVCTHPDARRQGLGAIVTARVAHDITARGETPFLHVAVTNDNARRVYEQMGFVSRAMVTFAGFAAPA